MGFLHSTGTTEKIDMSTYNQGLQNCTYTLYFMFLTVHTYPYSDASYSNKKDVNVMYSLIQLKITKPHALLIGL